MNTRVYSEVLQSIVTISIVVAIAAVLAKLNYVLPLRDTAIFCGWVIVAFYIPGDLINRSCGLDRQLKLSSTLRFFVCVAVGLCSLTVVYQIIREFDLPISVLQSGLSICSVLWVTVKFRRIFLSDKHKTSKWITNGKESAGILIVVAALILMLGLSHYRDIIITEAGVQYSLTSFNETAFHEGLINALELSYPPGPLYLSGGIDFSFYHLGLHLQIDLFKRLSGLDTAKLVYFYFSTLYFLLMSLLPFAIVRALGGSNRVAVVSGLLVYASDFSYVTALVVGDSAPALWNQLHIPVVYSLFTFNGILPALVALFCFILYFIYFSRKLSLGLLIVLMCIAYSAYLSKSSMGFQIAATGIFVCIFACFKQPQFRWLSAAMGFTLVLAAMVYLQTAEEHSLGGAVFEIRPFNIFKQVQLTYNIQDIGWYFLLPAYFCYVILTFGLRYLGYHAFANFRNGTSGERWTCLFIGFFTVSGFLLSDMIFIGLPNSQDNSIWFAVQSLIAAWLLVSIYLIDATKQQRAKDWILPLVVLVISFPSTIQFLVARSGSGEAESYFLMGASERDIVKNLRSIGTNAVILHPVNFNYPSLVSNFSGHISVFNGFRSFVHINDAVKLRVANINSFFSEKADNRIMNEVIDRYDVSYVLCAADGCGAVRENPNLRIEYENMEYQLFRVDGNGNHI